jgi:DNA mismatch repair ATPase MutL
MKKLLLLSLALLIVSGAWAQSSKKKPKKEENTEQTTDDNSDDGGDKDSKKTTKKEKDTKKTKESDKKETKKTPEKKPATKPATTKAGDDKPSPISILNYYYELPQDYLPQISDYIKRRKEEAPLVKTEDTKDLRKGFILNQELERGFLNLQLPNENKYTRMQLYKTGTTPLLAVEVTECNPFCDNKLSIYRRDTGQWRDKTSEYLPALDMKWVRKRLQEKYKEQYMDLDIYDSRGYNDDATLEKALMYVVSPDENKIIVREQNLPIDLYEMTWDGEKNKFVLKKLTD